MPEQLRRLGVEEVVILPDNDGPGEAYAATVAASCTALGLEVRVLRLPGLGPKGDVVNWLAAGHPRSELIALVEQARGS